MGKEVIQVNFGTEIGHAFKILSAIKRKEGGRNVED
jgi:hypothetical protein